MAECKSKTLPQSKFYSNKSFYMTPIQRKQLRLFQPLQIKGGDSTMTATKPEFTKVTKRKLQLGKKLKMSTVKCESKKSLIKKSSYSWTPITKQSKYDKYKNLQLPKFNTMKKPSSMTKSNCDNLTPIKQKLPQDADNLYDTSFVKSSSHSGPVFSMFTKSPSRSPMLKSESGKSSPKNVSMPKVPGTTRVRNLKFHLECRSSNQMIIDAGQKRFGPIQCEVCGMIYSANHLQDEEQHVQFHTRFMAILKYKGWKNERTLNVFSDGRIIKILPNDPKYACKKVEDILSVVDTDLGFDKSAKPSSYTTYLYVNNDNTIIGCLVAESLAEAQLLEAKPDDANVWVSSTKKYPCVCGVSRIWTHSMHRRKGVATKLLDALRTNYVLGCPVSMSQVALSDPTPAGQKFGVKYFKSNKFLVYNFKK